MQITPADKALAAGFAGAAQHLVPEPAQPRYFDISGLDAGGLKRELCIQADDGFAAVNAGLDLGWAGVVAHPHPQELTYEQGHARHPKALRLDAFVDAWRGWYDAQTEARAAMLASGRRDDRDAIERSYDRALVAQMTTPAANEFDRYHQRGAV